MKSVASLAMLLATVALSCTEPALGAASSERGEARIDPRSIPLIDQAGRRFTLDDLRGAPTLVTFVATRCTDACPIATALYSRLEARLKRSGMRVSLLEVTLDPDYDTPFIMARYAQTFTAGSTRWHLVSGRLSDVRALMYAFGVRAEKNRKGIPEVHSSFVYLIDPGGRLAKTFLLSTNLVDEVLHGLRAVVAYRRPAP